MCSVDLEYNPIIPFAGPGIVVKCDESKFNHKAKVSKQSVFFFMSASRPYRDTLWNVCLSRNLGGGGGVLGASECRLFIPKDIGSLDWSFLVTFLNCFCSLSCKTEPMAVNEESHYHTTWMSHLSDC